MKLTTLYIFIYLVNKEEEKQRKMLAMNYWNSGNTTENFIYNDNNSKTRSDDEDSTIKLLIKLRNRNLINNNLTMIEFAAGVGRITKNVLLKLDFIKKIDLLEPAKVFENTLFEIKNKNPGIIDKIYIMPGEKFEFE